MSDDRDRWDAMLERRKSMTPDLDAIRQEHEVRKAHLLDGSARPSPTIIRLHKQIDTLLAALEECQGERERWKKDCDAHLTLLSKRAIELNGKDAEIARLAAEVEGLKATP